MLLGTISLAAGDHVVPSPELHQQLVGAAQTRQANISKIERFLAHDAVQKAVKTAGSFGPESFRAGGRVRDVYDRLDGRRSVGELASRYTDEEKRLECLRAVYLLFYTGLAKAEPT